VPCSELVPPSSNQFDLCEAGLGVRRIQLATVEPKRTYRAACARENSVSKTDQGSVHESSCGGRVVINVDLWPPQAAGKNCHIRNVCRDGSGLGLTPFPLDSDDDHDEQAS
jgi:hypothetical protein